MSPARIVLAFSVAIYVNGYVRSQSLHMDYLQVGGIDEQAQTFATDEPCFNHHHYVVYDMKSSNPRDYSATIAFIAQYNDISSKTFDNFTYTGRLAAIDSREELDCVTDLFLNKYPGFPGARLRTRVSGRRKYVHDCGICDEHGEDLPDDDSHIGGEANLRVWNYDESVAAEDTGYVFIEPADDDSFRNTSKLYLRHYRDSSHAFLVEYTPAPCNTNPCFNNGLCSSNGTMFSCDCPDGFTGQLCEQGPCSDNPCTNNATCEVSGSGFVCRCNGTYIGDTCDQATGLCGGPDDQPCAEGLSCFDFIGDECDPAEGDVGCIGHCQASSDSDNPALSTLAIGLIVGAFAAGGGVCFMIIVAWDTFNRLRISEVNAPSEGNVDGQVAQSQPQASPLPPVRPASTAEEKINLEEKSDDVSSSGTSNTNEQINRYSGSPRRGDGTEDHKSAEKEERSDSAHVQDLPSNTEIESTAIYSKDTDPSGSEEQHPVTDTQ